MQISPLRVGGPLGSGRGWIRGGPERRHVAEHQTRRSIDHFLSTPPLAGSARDAGKDKAKPTGLAASCRRDLPDCLPLQRGNTVAYLLPKKRYSRANLTSF